MAYVPTAAESYGTGASVISLDSSHPTYVLVPDAKFLFTAEFHRAGPDLLLIGQDGERHLIPGYFAAAERPALTAPNGASLSPDLIHLLAGSVAPGQYAQAQPSAPPDSIGKIEKVVGDVTIVRNGVSVALNVGDAVYKSDIIQTGANSSVGIGFPDGTALQLVANTRMALNDYSYDPNGTSNTALFSLVEGTFAFVAGKVAHTGDMKIATPMATMGIRGTTGYVQEAATVSANSGNVSYSYVIVDDYGSTNHGQYDLIDQSGNVLATVSQTEYITYVTPQGIGLPPLVSTMPMSNSQVAFGQALIQQVFQTLNLINNPNPQTNGTNGSSTPEQLNSPLFPQLIHDQGTTPLDLNGSGGGSSSGTPLTVTIDIITPPPIIAATNVFIWTSPSSGTFQTAPDWNAGAVPAASDTVEINNPLVTVTIDQVETVNNLMVVAGAVVDVVNDSNGNGFLTILSGLDNGGLVEVGSAGSDPKLEVIGATTVASGARIEANGSVATVDFQNNEVVNAGIIDATHSGTVSFEFVTIDNVPGGNADEGAIIAQLGGTVTLDHTIINNTDGGLNDGSVVANGVGSTVFLYDGTTVAGGTLSTSDGGLIEIANGPSETNSNVTFDGSETAGGNVLAVTIASGSEVLVDGGASLTLLGSIVNEGMINVDAEVLGADLIVKGTVTLSGGGTVMLTGSADEITGDPSGGTLVNVDNTISGAGQIVSTPANPLALDNQINGVIEANGGTLEIDSVTSFTNSGTLLATPDSLLVLNGDTIISTGQVELDDSDGPSTLDFNGSSLSGGTVTVDGMLDSTGTSSISDAAITIDAGDTLQSTSGTLTIDPGSIDNTGLLEANGGTLTIDATTVTNTGGTVEVAAGSTLDLESATINNGIVTVDGLLDSTGTSAIDGAAITIASTGTLESTSGTLTIDPGSIDNTGLLEANGGTLTIDATTVTNTGGTVEVAAGSTLDLESATINNGIVTVDGLLDSTGTSAIDGAAITIASTGTLESTSGTLTIDPGSIDNTGLLEANGGTLTIDATTVTNTGGTVEVAAGSTLDLESATINNGIVTVDGLLDSTGTSAIDGAAITVASTGTLESTSGTLTIDPGSIDNTGLLEANGGTLTIDATTVTNTGGTVEVAAGSTLDLESATINNGIVTVDGLLDSTGTSAIDGAAITIASTGTLESTSGTLTIDPGSIDNTGLLEANGGTLTIDATTVTNTGGTVEVAAGSTLDLESATINNGIVTVDGLLDSTGTSAIDGAAITIASTGTLESTSGTLTIDPGSIDNTGLLEANGGTLTIDATTVTNTGGTVEVAAGSTLDLESATINNGIVTVDGLLDSTGTSAIDGAAITIASTGTLESTSGTLTIDPGSIDNTGLLEANGGTLTIDATTVTNTGGTVEVAAGSTLDLESATINNGIVTVDGLLDSTGTSAIDGAAITIASTGTLESTSGTLTIDPGSIDNTGLLEANGGTLTIDATTVTNTGGTVEVAAGSTLDLESATINNGIVTVDGLLDSTGTSAIDGAAITIASTGTLESTSGTLTIDPGSIDNTGLLEANGGTLTIDATTVTNTGGTVEVAAGSTLDLESATINNGIVTVDGLLDSTGTSAIDGAAITIASTGTLESTSGTLTIDPGSIDNTGLLEANGGTLTIDATTVTNTGGTVEVAAGSTLDLESATINNGIVTVDGLLDSTGTSAIDGAAITIASTGTLESTSGTLTIDPGSIDNTGLLEANGGTLTIDATTVTNTGGTVEVAAGSTLDLESATINNGIVTVDGLLDSTGTSAIDGAAITIASTGTLESTSGTLTIDPGSIDNTGLLEANGGTLEIDSVTSFTNSGTLLATPDSLLVLNGDTIISTGQVELDDSDGPSTLDFNGSSLSGGTVTVDGMLDSTGTSSISDAAITIDAGDTLQSTSGTLTIDPGSIDNTGLLEANGGTLTIDATTVTNTGGTVEVAAGSTLDLESATINNGIVTVDGLLDSTGTSAIDGAAITIASIGTLESTSGTLTIDPGDTIANAGLMEAYAGSKLQIDTTVANSGTIEALAVTGAPTLEVDVTGNITGTGSIDIFNHAKLEIGGAVSAGQTVTFEVSNGDSGLILDDPHGFSGLIKGLVEASAETAENYIDLKGFLYTFETKVISASYNSTTNITAVTISDGNSANNITLALSGDYQRGDIEFASDGSGGTLFSDPAANSGTVTIGSGTTLDIAAASTATVSFTNSNGNTGELVLNDSKDFTGQIVGFAGDGTTSNSDLINLADVNIADVVMDKTTYTDNGNGTGTLTLYNAQGQTLDSIAFVGSYQLANFTIENDGSGHTLIVDPPVSPSTATIGSGTPAVTGTVADKNDTNPTGIAGSPINLALTNPSVVGGLTTVTITGLPSDWQLNQGTNLGNGTWTVQADDLTTLTVLTAAAYAGAVELGVTESWTNASGATGLATIADNVETYATGSPIFAWSGDDTLTGGGGHDEFVFAQPIGSDAIYNFNVATDKIDLLGFANVASFGDIEGHVTADSNGDAVITLGAGETITLHGVNAGSLTAADFVFNQTPVVDNAGTLAVNDGATLPLDGTIDNTGIIALNGTGDQTELQIVGDGVTLQGGGQITMSDGAGDMIVGTTAATTLTNVDNTISGAGQIGAGDGNLTLVNEVNGTIEANIAGGVLTVDTGNDITNNGILEATNGGVLQIDDAVSGGGHAVIAGGTVAFEAAANIDVIFDNGTSTPAYGQLDLGDASAFAGQISGFSGTAPDAGHSDVIDLAGINYDSSSFSETYNASSGLLTVSDGSNIANLTLDNFDGTLGFASNGDGGTLITDPPATSSITADGVLSLPADGPATTYTESVTANGHGYVGSFSLDPIIDGNGSPSVEFQFALGNDQINLAPGQVLTQSYNVDIAAQNPADTLNQTVAVSIGGPGADNFVFAPGIGAETIANFDPQHDTIELNGFNNAHTVAELQSLITTDLHGDAVIDLGHNDSITLAGVTAGHLQAVLQSAVHLH